VLFICVDKSGEDFLGHRIAQIVGQQVDFASKFGREQLQLKGLDKIKVNVSVGMNGIVEVERFITEAKANEIINDDSRKSQE